ncbi:MAG: energy-coupling factor ABC transporter ATP-binding protein [Novibacillus thermophilus]
MSYLTLNDVTYRYPNGYKAVDGVSMSFEKGESVAIIGQNGAGKTTTVKLMNGLLKPEKGDVFIDGWNTKDYTTAQISKKVGYVFQNPDDQIFHNDVYSEIAFGPKNQKLPPEAVKENVMKAAERTGLTPVLEENPYNLPYSMRKFVTIASVLAMDTDVIILDEPTAGQDPAALDRLASIIQSLIGEKKLVMTITHDMEFVVNHFERVIVMADRRKIADKSKREVFWDFGILEQSMLKQPHISRLSHSLQLQAPILTIDDMIQCLQQKKRAQEKV